MSTLPPGGLETEASWDRRQLGTGGNLWLVLRPAEPPKPVESKKVGHRAHRRPGVAPDQGYSRTSIELADVHG